MSVYKPKTSPYFHFDFVWQGRRFYGSTGARTKRETLPPKKHGNIPL